MKPKTTSQLDSYHKASPRELTTTKVGNPRSYTSVKHHSLAPFICAEEYDCSREGANQRWCDASIQPSPYSFLPKNGVVARAHGCVLWWHVRITLLACLDRVQRMHEHIASRPSNSSREHCLSRSPSVPYSFQRKSWRGLTWTYGGLSAS